MTGRDVFDFYRFLLTVLVSTYAGVRLVQFFWRWQIVTRSAPRAEALARRYLMVQFLRVRTSRFALDLLTIAALLAVLAWLISLHWS